MASPETIGTSACENCGAVVYVKKNRGGFPYYRCGSCDRESREHSQKGARIFLQNVTLFQAETQPETPPEKAAKSGETPLPEPAPPPTPAPSPVPAARKKQPSSMVAAILNL